MKLSTLKIIIALNACLVLSCTKAVKEIGNESATLVSGGTPLAGTVDKTDTLKVMAYNVLNYGDGCQAATPALDAYLKTITAYVQPDLLSCEKMTAFDPASPLPANLASDISTNALNAAFPGRYNYATPTNHSGSSTMSVLYYNKQKLGFVRTETLVASITDFNLYTLYYKDPNLAITHDTTFLYVVVNHTKSGGSSTARDQQVTQEIAAVRAKFPILPNLVIMGDFNTRNSSEAGYQALVAGTNPATRMSDPPFSVDRKLQYPADWDNNPQLFSAYLTTSTRLSTTVPNSCGTGGGARSWYDHIFISPALVSGSTQIQYIPGSYRTVGNDGKRLSSDENSIIPVANTSAPDAVIQALYQFSNKYPVMIGLLVKAKRS